MVDYFAIGLTHLLMAFAAWRLVLRDDLDREPEPGADGRTPDQPGA
jgi:hypothetical protein